MYHDHLVWPSTAAQPKHGCIEPMVRWMSFGILKAKFAQISSKNSGGTELDSGSKSRQVRLTVNETKAQPDPGRKLTGSTKLFLALQRN